MKVRERKRNEKINILDGREWEATALSRNGTCWREVAVGKEGAVVTSFLPMERLRFGEICEASAISLRQQFN